MEKETVRRNYKRPELTVIRMDNSNIIATSGDFEEYSDGDFKWDN